MKLFIGGQKFEVSKEKPTVSKIKAFLDKSKDGELFVTQQLADAIKTNPICIRQSVNDLGAYSHKVSCIRYYGKPKTIKQLIKETSKP